MPAIYAPSAGIAGTPGKPGPARLAFLLLFPGFFFYQTLISMGVVGAVLGGYFSVVSLGLFPPLAYAYYLGIKASGYRIASTDLRFGFFLFYFFVIVAINAAFGANSTIVKTHLLSILYFINIYVIFKHSDFSERRTIATTLASLLLIAPVIVTFVEEGVVPRLPTAVLSMGLMIMAMLSLSSGLVLDTVTRGRREMKLMAYLAQPAPGESGLR